MAWIDVRLDTETVREILRELDHDDNGMGGGYTPTANKFAAAVVRACKRAERVWRIDYYYVFSGALIAMLCTDVSWVQKMQVAVAVPAAWMGWDVLMRVITLYILGGKKGE